MIFTEEEAKTKRCQESYPAAEGLTLGGFTESVPLPPQNTTAHGGGFNQGFSHARRTAPLMCIGSECMAWRWDSESREDRPSPWLPDDMPLSAAELDTRTDNCLRNSGMVTVGDVRKLNQAQLLRLPMLGRTSLREIMATIGIGIVGRGYCGKAGKP